MKFPEKVAIGLIIAVVLFPPWSEPMGQGYTRTTWDFIWDGFGSIDVLLLLVELGIVGAVYFLLSRAQSK